uniref:Uncharacterized protein n=1 Tax=Phage sp. ctGns7 TaxID=2828003 RepID=A0A8S5S969_9VIRU|nr:MAG TPA: hypothetical protein [Phage sp. ctGns7]
MLSSILTIRTTKTYTPTLDIISLFGVTLKDYTK